MGAFWAVVIRLHAFLGPVLSVFYPMTASVKAIESPNKEDDEQWLTYWIIYSLITLFEATAYRALAWFPLWYPIKLLVISWLVLPQFKGASFVYDQLVRKYLLKNSGRIEQKLKDAMSPQTKAEVEKFINENGLDALDKIMEGKDGSKLRPSPTKESQERY